MGHAKAVWKVAPVSTHTQRFPAHHKESTCMHKPPPSYRHRATVPSPRATRAQYTGRHVENKEGEETSRSRRKKRRKRRDKGQKTTRHTNCGRRVLTSAPGSACRREPSAPCLQAHHDHTFPVVCASFVCKRK